MDRLSIILMCLILAWPEAAWFLIATHAPHANTSPIGRYEGVALGTGDPQVFYL